MCHVWRCQERNVGLHNLQRAPVVETYGSLQAVSPFPNSSQLNECVYYVLTQTEPVARQLAAIDMVTDLSGYSFGGPASLWVI